MNPVVRPFNYMNNLILYFTFSINFTTQLVVTSTLRINEVLRLLVVLSTIEKKKKPDYL
jgi:hypothetical protein